MRAVLISVSKAPSRQCAADALPAIWDHTVLTATQNRRTRLCHIWEKGQTSAYYYRNLPSGEAGTNLYCLVNRGRCVNNLTKVITWQCTVSESNLQPQGYKFGMLPLYHQVTKVSKI